MACGGFISSCKSVACGALNPFFCQNPNLLPKKTKTAAAAKPLLACQEERKIETLVSIAGVVVIGVYQCPSEDPSMLTV